MALRSTDSFWSLDLLHRSVHFGDFPIPECYAVGCFRVLGVNSRVWSFDFLSFSLLFLSHKWHLAKKVSSYNNLSSFWYYLFVWRLIRGHALDQLFTLLFSVGIPDCRLILLGFLLSTSAAQLISSFVKTNRCSLHMTSSIVYPPIQTPL